MHAVLRTIESLAARLAVTLILALTATIVAVARRIRRPAADSIGAPDRHRIMLVGTFYNDAWFDAHVEPLLACDHIEHVTVVTDKALRPMQGVSYQIPPKWLTRIIGRTPARCLFAVRAARKNRCNLLVGYHIMPNALICLVAARLLSKRCAYQMTGGPVQLIGGGVGSENTLLRRQRKAGPVRERWMHHLVRQFDAVIVRGRNGLDYMRGIGMEARTTIIPAGIDVDRFEPRTTEPAEFELITVGRLVPVKRYDRLLRIVCELVRARPDIGCTFVGDGPERRALESLARQLGIVRNVRFLGRKDDVAPLLRRARIFVLTSESEGQSIAMMEAMASGLSIAAPDVGELTDLLLEGETGIVIEPENPAESAARIDALLEDESKRIQMGLQGREAVIQFAATAAVAKKWGDAMERFSGASVTTIRPAAARLNHTSSSNAGLTAPVARSET